MNSNKLCGICVIQQCKGSIFFFCFGKGCSTYPHGQRLDALWAKRKENTKMEPRTIAVLLLACCCLFSPLYSTRADHQVGNHLNDDVKVQAGIEDDPALSLALAKLAKTAGASGYRIEPVFSSQTFAKATAIFVTVILLQNLCRIQHRQL